MRRFQMFVAGCALLVAAGLCGSVASAATATPTLFTITAANPEVSLQGAEKSWPIKFNENAAIDAVSSGGLWLPNPEGGRIYAKYQRHVLHANGIWTWIGTVSTVHGDQSVVLTFGKGGVMFGYIPRASDWPIRIVTTHGKARLIITSAKALEQSPEWLRMHAKPDYVIPPRKSHATGGRVKTESIGTTNPLAAASAASPSTITVMVAYSSGLVTAYGSVSAVLTRIQYLVDWANQAYINSNVYQQLQLVDTVEVNYTDGNSDTDALYDLTGVSPSGTVPVPPALQGIAPLRAQYGADLVSLLRPFDAAAEGAGECGVGWMNGAGGGALSPTYGYSVVSDIHDSTVTSGVSCLDLTFAHELGHNMGNDHDRATANGTGEGATSTDGAYPYSYGYKSSSVGIATIMAYPDSGETQLQVFSNPDIYFCKNNPCGVADNSSSSADNAHSMNNTAPFTAQFEPPIAAGQAMRADLTSSGVDDLLWRQPVSGYFAYWQLSGGYVSSYSSAYLANTSFTLVASGKFFGAGQADDLVWANSGSIWMWVPAASGFNSARVANMPAGWKIIGAGYLDGSGDEDLIFRNISTSSGNGGIAYWRMRGARVVYHSPLFAMWPSYHEAAIGDFGGNGDDGILWTNGNDLVMWSPSGGGFMQTTIGSYPVGWKILGCGDVDGNGTCDLIWYNATSGNLAYWLMSGAAVTHRSPAIPPPQIQGEVGPMMPVTIGDFNGDGRVDVVWLDSAHFNMWLSTSTGSGFGAASYFDTAPARWSLATPPPGN